MKKTLKELSQGQQFTHGGVEWVVLDHMDAGTLSLAAEIIEEKEFDEENLNDWRGSSLMEYLNGDFLDDMIASGAAGNDFLEMTVDLTADDGMTDYGTDICKIALLTADQYRKYRRFIPNASGWWWLITPYSCAASYSHYVPSVFSDGSLYYPDARYGTYGVRPACRLSSDITVTVEGSEEPDDTKIYEQAVSTWGKAAQIDMMIEEMTELTKELLNERRGRDHNIAEELADVKIMIAQTEIIFQNTEEVKRILREKVERLDQRLHEKGGGHERTGEQAADRNRNIGQ